MTTNSTTDTSTTGADSNDSEASTEPPKDNNPTSQTTLTNSFVSDDDVPDEDSIQSEITEVGTESDCTTDDDSDSDSLTEHGIGLSIQQKVVFNGSAWTLLIGLTPHNQPTTDNFPLYSKHVKYVEGCNNMLYGFDLDSVSTVITDTNSIPEDANYPLNSIPMAVEDPVMNHTDATKLSSYTPTSGSRKTGLHPRSGPDLSEDLRLRDFPRMAGIGLLDIYRILTFKFKTTTRHDVKEFVRFTGQEITPGSDADPFEKFIAAFVYSMFVLYILMFFRILLA